MYNLNKYTLQYIGYNKIGTSRMAVHSINTSCHHVQIYIIIYYIVYIIY